MALSWFRTARSKIGVIVEVGVDQLYRVASGVDLCSVNFKVCEKAKVEEKVIETISEQREAALHRTPFGEAGFPTGVHEWGSLHVGIRR